MEIRRFRNEDAAVVSDLIVENLRKVNIHDYSEELMDVLAAHNSPEQLCKLAEKCDAFVAVEDGAVLGVTMLDRNKVKCMFVRVEMQGNGVGKSLITHVEMLARRRKFSRLVLDSSITAVGFYTRCGYRVVRKVNKPFRGVRNVVFEMVKILS